MISRRELFTSLFEKARSLTQDRPPTSARIERGACLAWRRSFCTVCEEHCPIQGAITLDKGRPIVNVEFCDGCGICSDVCPAPRNAISLI